MISSRHIAPVNYWGLTKQVGPWKTTSVDKSHEALGYDSPHNQYQDVRPYQQNGSAAPAYEYCRIVTAEGEAADSDLRRERFSKGQKLQREVPRAVRVVGGVVGADKGSGTGRSMGISTSTQTIEDIKKRRRRNASRLGIDSGTQTEVGDGTDSATQTLGGDGTDSSTQTSGAVGADSATQTLEGVGTETGTQTEALAQRLMEDERENTVVPPIPGSFPTLTPVQLDIVNIDPTETIVTGTQTFQQRAREIETQTDGVTGSDFATQTDNFSTPSRSMGIQTRRDQINTLGTQTQGSLENISTQTSELLVNRQKAEDEIAELRNLLEVVRSQPRDATDIDLGRRQALIEQYENQINQGNGVVDNLNERIGDMVENRNTLARELGELAEQSRQLQAVEDEIEVVEDTISTNQAPSSSGRLSIDSFEPEVINPNSQRTRFGRDTRPRFNPESNRVSPNSRSLTSRSPAARDPSTFREPSIAPSSSRSSSSRSSSAFSGTSGSSFVPSSASSDSTQPRGRSRTPRFRQQQMAPQVASPSPASSASSVEVINDRPQTTRFGRDTRPRFIPEARRSVSARPAISARAARSVSRAPSSRSPTTFRTPAGERIRTSTTTTRSGRVSKPVTK